MENGHSTSRGAGTLVAPGIVLTALNVVADRRAIPIQLYPGLITLTFPDHKTAAHLRGDGMSAPADWALLECESAPPAIPVPLGRLSQSKVDWETHGFPDSAPGEGESLAGIVENFEGDAEGVAAFHLLSDEASADDGVPARGLSGAPVIVAGWMVGHMRHARRGEGQAAGTMYACPAGTVAARYPELLTLGEVSRRRSVSPEANRRRWSRWVVLAGILLAALAIGFLLLQIE